MRFLRTHVLASVALASLALSACGKSDKPPEGQVVATVDGNDVTVHELRAEIDAIPGRGGNVPRKLVEQVALANIIERKMLAEEARKRDLEKNPQYLLDKSRADEVLLVSALQADIQRSVKPIVRETAQKYVSDNPQMYADRKILTLDQVQFLRPANIDTLGLTEAKTMAEVEAILKAANIDYRRAPQPLDTLTTNPKLTKEVLEKAAGSTEPFLFADQPAGAPVPVIYISTVTATKAEPFIGERAVSHAQNLLAGEQIQKALIDQLKDWKTAYKDKIVYAKGYGPPVLPKSPAPAPAN